MAERVDPGGDFDHLQRDVGIDPPDTYRSLRVRCPVARSSRYGGFSVLSRYENVRQAAQRWSVFSSDAISIPGDRGRSIPIMVDPPEHARYRAPLAAYFSRARVARMEPEIRRLTTTLIDGFVERGSCEISTELSQPMPVTLLLTMLGIPPPAIARMRPWIDTLVYATTPDGDEGRSATLGLQRHVRHVVRAERNAGPRDDLMGFLRAGEAPGAPFTEDEVANIIVTLIYAGLGPTTFLINGALVLLDTDREARRRIIDDPDLLPVATEEILRYVSPVRSIGRRVKRDALLFGHQFRVDERVLLLWSSANRDEGIFARADEFVVDRSPNRHMALGFGVHRCVGAGLARLAFRVALEEILRRIPDYRIADPAGIGWQVGHTFGVNRLPIEFTPGRRAGMASA